MNRTIYSTTCENCGKEIFVARWAVKTIIRSGKNKGKEIRVPVWRHRPQVGVGALCGEGVYANLVATPPEGFDVKEL